jgi:hypothetical protein
MNFRSMNLRTTAYVLAIACITAFVIATIAFCLMTAAPVIDAAPLAAPTPIAPQSIILSTTGITPTFNATSAQANTFQNNGRTIVEVKNAGASPVTVTFVTPYLLGGVIDIPDLTLTVPATTGDRIAGPFPIELFGTDLVISTSVQTSVTMAAFRY